MNFSTLLPDTPRKRDYKKEYVARKEKHRKYYADNREKILAKGRERSKASYWKDPEKRREYQRNYYKNNIEAYKKRNKEYDRKKYILSTEERRKNQYIYSIRSRARKNGVPCTITASDLIFPTHCPLLGVELDYSMSPGYNPNHASVDRIVQDLGYVPGNVWIICRKANVMKNDASREELQKFVSNLKLYNII